jgi:hypothetical protein
MQVNSSRLDSAPAAHSEFPRHTYEASFREKLTRNFQKFLSPADGISAKQQAMLPLHASKRAFVSIGGWVGLSRKRG